MPVPTRSSAYGATLRALLNRASESKSGIEIEMPDENTAIQFRQKLYKLRSIERKALDSRFGLGTPMPWDEVRIVVHSRPSSVGPKWFLGLMKDEAIIAGLNVYDVETGQSLGKTEDLVQEPTALPLTDPFGDKS